MASIRKVVYTRPDGSTKPAVWQVLWRENRRQTSATFATRKKAARFQAVLDSEGSAADRADAVAVRTTTDVPTLDEWMTDYIDHRTGITDGTRAKYRSVYALSFGMLLGELELDLITRRRVADAINVLASKPPPLDDLPREPLSAKSIANAHGLLAAALNAAQQEQLITQNPCHGMRLPRGTKREHRLLTHAEFKRLYDATPQRWRPLVVTLVGTGMRWGEATGLRVGDVDLDNRRARIVRAWKQGKGGSRVYDIPKSKRSRRTIALPDEVVDAIRPLVTSRAHDEFVFVAPRGGSPWNGTFHRDVWSDVVTAAQLQPPPRIHDLRHTHAAWLIAAGISLPEIQARLGHESITTTIDTYGGLLPDLQIRAAAATDVALGALKEIEAAPTVPDPVR